MPISHIGKNQETLIDARQDGMVSCKIIGSTSNLRPANVIQPPTSYPDTLKRTEAKRIIAKQLSSPRQNSSILTSLSLPTSEEKHPCPTKCRHLCLRPPTYECSTSIPFMERWTKKWLPFNANTDPS